MKIHFFWFAIGSQISPPIAGQMSSTIITPNNNVEKDAIRHSINRIANIWPN